MTVDSLRAAIAERAGNLRREGQLFSVAVKDHKKRWRICPCSWCEKKREASSEVSRGGGIPRYQREEWRERMKAKYRYILDKLEND